jgi:hypothetical protein
MQAMALLYQYLSLSVPLVASMLEVGNSGLTIAEQRTHFACGQLSSMLSGPIDTTKPRILCARLKVCPRALVRLWCMVKSPLLIGSDVRSIANDSLALLKNKECETVAAFSSSP